MHVVIFEGTYWKTFAPLSLSRPVFMLATGMSTLLDKQLRYLSPTRLTLWVRPELAEHCRARIVPKMKIPTAVNEPLDDQPALLVSGRTLHMRQFDPPDHEAVVVDDAPEGGIVRTALVRGPGLSYEDAMGRTDPWMRVLNLPRMEPQTRMVESLWDLISWNEESLIEDSTKLRDACRAKAPAYVHCLNEEDVCIGEDVKLAPGCVLDASAGPVVIAEHAVLGANSVIQGPCYLGPYVNVRPLTLIRPGTSIGMMSKVGGEISNSIILGYSNKAHDGFLGDSYIGKWVNFGAGTTTSNLKNTYGEISMQLGGRQVPTGRRFLGSIIGDHTKTAILTRLMTGTYIGFCCMVAGNGTAPRFLPSFSFLTERGIEPYQMDKAIEVTKRVYARRDRPWTETDERVMRYVAQMAPMVEQVPNQ